MLRLSDVDEALRIESEKIGDALSKQSYAFATAADVLFKISRDEVKFTQEQKKILNKLYERAVG